MRRRDHMALGRFLLERSDHADLQKHRKAFLLGCVEPDINMASYMRGMGRCRGLLGHNAENSRRYIARRFEHIKEKGLRHAGDYFRLGVVLHYVADAFTGAHNGRGGGNLLRHRIYEESLHRIFSLGPFPAGDEREITDLMTSYLDMHARYRREKQSPETDRRYIMSACEKLLKGSLRYAAA